MGTLVVHLITELDVGGAQMVLYRFLERMAGDERYEFKVACLFNGDKVVAERIRGLGVEVYDVGMTAWWRVDRLVRLWGWLRRERPFLLHCWLYHANIIGRLVGRLAGVPRIITARRNVDIGGERREKVKRLTAGWDDGVIAVCELARQKELAASGQAEAKVVTIYNDIDVAKFERVGQVALRAGWGIGAEDVVWVAVGRLHEQKGHETLLAAWARVCAEEEGCWLLIVGEGELEAGLRRQAAVLGVEERVIFTGGRQDVPDILAVCDGFVLASYWEGLPNVVLEGMAAGLPVVATAVGGTPELVVDGETGMLVPAREAAPLAAALLALTRDGERRRAWGAAGRRRAEVMFAPGTMAAKTVALYDLVMARER
ncbi:MAG TPA: glycosyltransferase [Anaerolineae bacterium]|nr:glycosyltransferase [Anaerolineae bacterium]